MAFAIMLMEDSHLHAFRETLRALVDVQHIVTHKHRVSDFLTVEQNSVTCMCPMAPVPLDLITQQDNIQLKSWMTW